MRKLFRRYIVAGAVFGLTQYVLLDPWFSGDHGRGVTRRCRSWERAPCASRFSASTPRC